MAASGGRNSQHPDFANQESVWQHLADSSELSRDDFAVDYVDQPENPHISRGFPSLDSQWQFIERDAITGIFPFESPTPHDKPVNMGDLDCAGLMDYAFLQLPAKQSSQGDQWNFDSHLSSRSSSILANIKSKETSANLSVPIYPARARRGLPRRRSRYMIHENDRRTFATFIPATSGPTDPLERWKNSPPEAEAASLSAIQNALDNASIDAGANQGLSLDPDLNDLFQTPRRPASQAASTISGASATSASSYRSNQSRASILSHSSQSGSDKTPARIQKSQGITRRRKRTTANNPRIFCCTFCCDKFKTKYDWVRHEKSLHLDLESWSCAPFGGSVVLPSTGRIHCAYCNQLDPTPLHLEQHNHGVCQHEIRTFRRKDHLFQHLRLVHHLETMPIIDDWKHVVPNFLSRCGFCNSWLSSWDDRADHLTVHFRQGCTMAQWKGDHEFPPHIAAQVRHSVPPYLLDFESRSFVPFSATNGAVNDHLSQMLSRASFLNATDDSRLFSDSMDPTDPPVELQAAPEPHLDCYSEVLTRHLSHYARQMMSTGVIPTDEMFQVEARRLLFDSEDQWNQTMADNPEWLAKFREEQRDEGSLYA